MSQQALAVRSRGVVHAGAGHRVPRTVVVLALLDGFVCLTAAIGAATVHTLPDDIYRFHYLYGPVAPTIGLGLVAALSLVALYCLVTRRRLAAAISIVAGVALVVFELVESFTVGSFLTPPVGLDTSGRAALWLQPLYIGVGVTMVVLGGRSADPATRPPSRRDAITGSAAKAAAAVLVALTFGAASGLGRRREHPVEARWATRSGRRCLRAWLRPSPPPARSCGRRDLRASGLSAVDGAPSCAHDRARR